MMQIDDKFFNEMKTSSSNFEVVKQSQNYGYDVIEETHLRTKDGVHQVLKPKPEEISKNAPCYIYLNKNENPNIAIYPAIAVMGIPDHNICCFCNVNVSDNTDNS